MGSKSKSTQLQEPSAQQTAASNALLAYLLGSSVNQFAGSPKTEADNTFGTFFDTGGQPQGRSPTPSLGQAPDTYANMLRILGPSHPAVIALGQSRRNPTTFQPSQEVPDIGGGFRQSNPFMNVLANALSGGRP